MPRLAKPFTKALIESLHAKRPETDIWKRDDHPDGRGLLVRQSRSGSTIWYFDFGRSKLRLGDYPALALAEARKRVGAARAAIAAGADPLARKLARKTDIASFGDLGERWLAHTANQNRERTVKFDAWTFHKHVRPALGALRPDALAPGHIEDLKLKLYAAGHTRMGNRCIGMIKTIVRYANRFHRLDLDDPTVAVSLRKQEPRDRVLTEGELRSLWCALNDPKSAPAPLSHAMALCLRLGMVTLQRRGEVAEMHESEIDEANRVWTMPSGLRTKNGKAHAVPLSELAWDIIKSARAINGGSRYVFPAPRKPDAPLARHSVSRAMNRLCQGLGIENARLHDFRATGATMLIADLDAAPLAVSAALNHTSDTGGAALITKRVYLRKDLLTQKRQALNAWAAKLALIVGEAPSAANVVLLRGQA